MTEAHKQTICVAGTREDTGQPLSIPVVRAVVSECLPAKTTDDWGERVIANMKRMYVDEAYRQQIVKWLS